MNLYIISLRHPTLGERTYFEPIDIVGYSGRDELDC
jgi:hypothetical protein